MADIRFGVTYSERKDFSDLPDYARRVEELGLDSIWVTENITSDAPALECFTSMSFMAAHTSRLTIGTSVLLLPLRNPVLVAQTVNSLDVLSGGRVVLGVGVGNAGPDFDAYGGDSHQRAGRADESLEIIKRLWTESSVTHDGKHFHLKDYTLVPRPLQKPHPPIQVGGSADAVLRRAGRFADALVPVGKTPEQAKSLFEKAEAYAREYGRDPSSMARVMHIFLCLAGSPEESSRISGEVLTERYQSSTALAADGPFLFGTPEDAGRVVQAFVDIGVKEFVFNMTCRPEEAISQVETFATEIMPRWR